MLLSQAQIDFARAFSNWIDNQDHRLGCGHGTVVQSGPMEGNKIPCTCGLAKLQRAADHLARNL